ncbi:MAG TPA: hypothetical protein VJT11_04130 [Nitrospiraceae bacterium]|nr:hypothetical protein [Nitrospiraceae bacterium]
MEQGLLTWVEPLELPEDDLGHAIRQYGTNRTVEPGLLTRADQASLEVDPSELPDEFPGDDLASALRQYGATRPADMTGSSVTASPPSIAKPITRTPTLHAFLNVAQKENPGVPRSRLAAYWNQTYGHVDPNTLPTWETFLPAALQDNPGKSERHLRQYWQDTYGILGALEKNSAKSTGKPQRVGM